MQPIATFYEVPVLTGDVLLVLPVSPYVREPLWELTKAQFPDPDPAEFAEDETGYSAAKQDALGARLQQYYAALIASGCVWDTAEGRGKTLLRHARKLQHCYRVMGIQPDKRDHFQDLVEHVLIRSFKDVLTVAHCASENVKAEDLMRGVRLARYYVHHGDTSTTYSPVDEPAKN